MSDPANLTNALVAVLLAAVAAGNPPRRLLASREAGATTTRLAMAALLAGLPLAGLGLAGGAVLDALDVSVPTGRLAAGLVLVVVALVQLVTPFELATPLERAPRDRSAPPDCPPTPAEPRHRGGGGAGGVVPLAFPHLLRPELALIVLVVGADHGAGAGLAAAALPLGLTVAASPGLADRAPLAAVLARAVAVVGVLTALDLVLDGIFAL